MTHFLQDILRQPAELRKSLAHTMGPGWPELQRAAAAVREAERVYIAGIGSSWNAGVAVQHMFHANRCPAHLVDAAEFVHFVELPPKSVILTLSRSGRSIEIVQMLAKARQAGAVVIGVTNTPDSPLAREAGITLLMNAAFDHQVSVTMYTAPAMIGALLALLSVNRLTGSDAHALTEALIATEASLAAWQSAIQESDWLAPQATYYFLARGASLSSCHESKLLWEEAAKSPATAMGTGAFRHGPQEMITPGLRIGLWIDGGAMREQDLALAHDLVQLGANVMLIGQRLESGAADLVLSLPPVPPQWQFLIDSIPAQLAAERLAHLRGMNCDAFRLCSYIVEGEGGLLPASADHA